MKSDRHSESITRLNIVITDYSLRHNGNDALGSICQFIFWVAVTGQPISGEHKPTFDPLLHNNIKQTQWIKISIKDEKEPASSKNELNQNPGLAKTEPSPKVKNVQEPEPNQTLSRKEPNRTWTQM